MLHVWFDPPYVNSDAALVSESCIMRVTTTKTNMAWLEQTRCNPHFLQTRESRKRSWRALN